MRYAGDPGRPRTEAPRAQQAATTPNYRTKIALLKRLGRLPRDAALAQLTVMHDSRCVHFVGQACDCDPLIQRCGSRSAAWRP